MLSDLIAEIDAHLAKRSVQGRPLAESTFGFLVVNDGKLLQRLRSGGQITVAKAETIKAWIEDDSRAVAA